MSRFRHEKTQRSCDFQNAILTREYDFTFTPDFAFLPANKNPAARCHCENEMEAMRKIARFIRSRVWGAVIPNQMDEGGKTHFGVFVFAGRILL